MNSKIGWCKTQKTGIRLIEPNESISAEYVKASNLDFDVSQTVNDKWMRISGYYACYNSVYAILMKAGVKCEVHDCTLALMSIFGFDDKDVKFMTDLKIERINVQYYLKNASFSLSKHQILEVMTKCKMVLKDLNDDTINEIRMKLR